MLSLNWHCLVVYQLIQLAILLKYHLRGAALVHLILYTVSSLTTTSCDNFLAVFDFGITLC
jgi:hypothetical protein